MLIHPNCASLESAEFSIVRDAVMNPWSPERYSSPVPLIGVAEVEGLSDLDLPDVLDMAIKVPGSEVVLPDNVQSLSEYILFCTSVHERLVDAPEQYYSYLTINQGLVKAGTTQRNAGIHFDGMQGVRYPKKLPACHQFLVSTDLTTTWHVQPFDTSELDVARDNWFRAFEKQANRTAQTLWRPRPNQVVLSTAYGVHESTAAEEDTEKTIVRVEFSRKQADRIGNTVSELSRDWEWYPRPIPAELT